MTWRVPPFDRALVELEAYVRATWKPIGILVAGSIVRGEAGPTSDLDVFVVHEAPWRLREQRRRAGRAVRQPAGADPAVLRERARRGQAELGPHVRDR